ncbi:AMP-binding protein [Allonocardiopsis opalescens]|uniref:Acetyl-CoA synthetase n=1 Tax=Allonocardiopsis opalescens TaxID=1144618 RepID=A0A2T0PWI5_9ACTN|nr:AMP-binding protein [Allonocardiopsis opalescens]PRX95728.1 acetyl-CoA synthetase [Allonocardiopsis opalescens]
MSSSTASAGREATEAFRTARDLLLTHREDPEGARRAFHWPVLDRFNWALDWFDVIAAEHPDRPALRVVALDGAETSLTYGELSRRSSQVANWLRAQGVDRGEHILLLLGNQVELWETLLAAIKLGAVVIPATPLLTADDIADRIERGKVAHVVADAADTGRFDGIGGHWTRVSVGPAEGWLSYTDAYQVEEHFEPSGPTRATDPLLLYFTSGTTAAPKLVEHTHASYPVGHLSTMYWIGLRPGDVHLNVSSPGWAKHAWSSVFAPWNAQATVLVVDYGRFSADALLDRVVSCGADTLCAPPTVWRMLIQADLSRWRVPLREAVAAGEPLNPEVIEQVRRAWGLTVRDGFGQTETTAQIGNPPGQPVRPGSMGRPLPGYEVALIDPVTGAQADEGEICLPLDPRPLGLTTGYRDSAERTAAAMRDGFYHTGDVAVRDADGYITYVGRTDDVFKASDYRISPFELESVLIQHEAVAEAAVVPSPDPLRLAVPKAYVTLAAGVEPGHRVALSILRHARERLAPYKRVRRVEFAELPKTVSGKIRRVELRGREQHRPPEATGEGARLPGEFWEEDFPDLKG